MLKTLKQTIDSFSSRQKLFLLCAMACSFLISLDYAIIRPVSSSLFIQGFGAKALPYVWIFSIPLNFIVVSLYNRYVSRLSCFKLFLIAAASVIIVNICAALFVSAHKNLSFVFFAWKDIYVMLMFQLLWSVIHSTIDTSRAKYLYGFLFAVGATGGLAGSIIAGQSAVALGSERLLFFTLPVYLFLMVAYFYLIRYSDISEMTPKKEGNKSSSLVESMRLIGGSKLLFAILLMVVFMQVTVTLTDFQFNTFLEKYITEKDVRTAYLGRLLGFGNIITLMFQLIGVWGLIKVMGKYKTHLLIPFVLCANFLAFSIYPSFFLISFNFLTIKAFDFSIFSVIKEMLYIPLKTEEKFKAKALIDVFMYRGAKVFASIFILALQTYLSAHVIHLVSWLNIALFVSWIFVVVSIKDGYETSSAKASIQ